MTPASRDRFEAFYREQRWKLVRRATAVLTSGNSALAEDLVHDAMLDVMRNWNSVEYPSSYVWTAIKNGFGRAHRRSPEPFPSHEFDELPRSTVDELATVHETDFVLDTLKQL